MFLSWSCFNGPQVIKDWKLFVLVGVMVAVDMGILIVGMAVPQSLLNATLVLDQEHDETGINVSPT